MAARLQAMEQQVETLQRIVNLKDDQIAALQNALTGDEGAIELEQAATDEAAVDAGLAAQIETLEGEVPVGGEELTGEDAGDTGTAVEEVVETAPEAEVVEVVAEPVVAVVEPAPAEAPAAPQPGGFMSYIWYVLGAVVLAVLGFVFMRRRGDSIDDEATTTSAEDVFADVELQEQVLEVEEAAEPAIDIEEEEDVPVTPPASRGYGQRKNDEYASDVEASDALAEADIYIAYGRYPQAIDLLQNALVTDPDNAEFRLKLLEVHVLMRDRASATKQLSQLESVGDAGVIARAGALIAELDNKSAGGAAGRAAGELDAAGPDMMAEIEESLEADFSGLEIEPDGDDDDLDLSADFEATDLSAEDLDEDLVIAAESSGMSTKLDLARAYLDMGDEGGARQILEEVAAEGDEELQAEARALLDRIG
jgi:pilus assembly protein FimV